MTAKQFSQFPHLRIVLDCTEIFCEKPSSLQANKEVYSNYKSHTTFKYLVGISPHPAVVYVSKAWGGRASDKRITQTSADLLDKLKPNDEVMADRGFEIEGACVQSTLSEAVDQWTPAVLPTSPLYFSIAIIRAMEEETL